MTNNKPKINLKNITNQVKEILLGIYGVNRLAKKDEVYLLNNQTTKKGKSEEGVFVTVGADGNSFALDVYLVLAQGIKITETLRECQKIVMYNLNLAYPKLCQKVNVYALSLAL